MNLVRLIQAILSRAREREGYVTKTKLVKYLYLFDLEHYRRTGRTFTGFAWIFHLYGPWAREFEELYGRMRHEGDILVRPGTRPELDTELLETPRWLDLAEAVDDATLELTFRHVVDEWADRRLGDMLDYVYFHTEPMEGAERGARLDFARVDRELRLTSWPQHQPDRRDVERMRRALAPRLRETGTVGSAVRFTPPPYDEAYFEALRSMQDDDDE